MNIYILRGIDIVQLSQDFREDTLVSALKLSPTRFQRITGFFPRIGTFYLRHQQKNETTPVDDS